MSKRFTENEIGSYVAQFYKKYKSNPNQTFFFDFTLFEWISNQNLLLLSSIIKYLYTCNASFKIKLFKSDLNDVTEDEAKTIVQLWEVWKLYEVFDRPNDHFENYLIGFSNSSIPYLKDRFNIKNDGNIYKRLGITPFVVLNVIDDYKDENLLETEISPIFDLEEIILNEIKSENSQHPFVEDTLSSIITRELYENFLDHYQSSFFTTDDDMSFMSISLKRKLGRDKYYLKNSFVLDLTETLSGNYNNLKRHLEYELDISKSFLIQVNLQKIRDIIKEESLTKGSEVKLIERIEKEDFNNKQYILGKNIKEELTECEEFFKDKNKHHSNIAYIQYSFIDYGVGIPETILNEYLKENEKENIDLFNQPDHNDLLKFAFKHYTSRFPIIDKHGQTNKYIPRGLFDVLTIAQRYRGLLIVRSNYGKLIFNFKNTNDFEKAVQPFGNPNEFFPGTYITMYIPELSSEIKFDKSVIRCEPVIPKKKVKPKNINLFSLLGSEFVQKERLYADLIMKLKAALANESEFARLNYISFFGIEDRTVINKAIYYLLTDYEINSNNAVVVMHPPKKIKGNEKGFVSELNDEIQALNSTIKNFRIHPLPFIYYDPIEDDVSVDWIGVYNDADKNKLDNLLYEEYSIALTDFVEPDNIKGNLLTADNYGNVNGRLPNRTILSKYYHLYTENLIEGVIEKNNLLKSNGLYLCNGNYFQNQFLQISNILDNRTYRDVLAIALFQQILYRIIRKEKIDETQATNYLFDSKRFPLSNHKRNLKYIAVTSSSHKIIKSFCEQGLVYKQQANEKPKMLPYIIFDNYLDVENDEKTELITDNTDYIIICDAISTGNLVKRLDNLICGKTNSELLYIATFADNLDENFENTKDFIHDYREKLISLYSLPIEKYRAHELTKKDYEKTLIRINPFTNLPIEFSESSTITESIILYNKNRGFLGLIDSEDIQIRFQVHNNLIHPFFFNIGSVLQKENEKLKKDDLSNSVIYTLLIDGGLIDSTKGNYAVFYPKGSGIEYLDKNLFNSKISQSHSIKFFELERFITESGWKFPNSSDYFKHLIQNTPNILILDDGTCTGDSLYQMINEISYFEPNRIVLLTIISRIDNYKREFLSKLKTIKKPTNREESIELNICFGTQWHIPTFYLNNNPYTKEIKWLEGILAIQNTPQFIRKNALKILDTISPTKDKSIDYKYFPKDRSTGKVPKKDILLARNEIGKIAGYRFYKESFDWYNQLTFSKGKNDFLDKSFNKQIELLAMCLLYEPYLYGTISKSFPDIRAHLELFVENVFFEINNQKIDLDEDLYYDWSNNKKDLIHLFFIVYRDAKFLEVIKKHENILTNFLYFAGDNERALDYILYKLSFYFTANDNKNTKSLLDVKNAIQSSVSKYPSLTQADQNFIEKMKRFIHFTSSLSSNDNDDSFENSKSKIENYFNQVNNPDYHNVGLNNDKSLINAHFVEIGRLINTNKDYDDVLVMLKEKLSENLIPYINLILSFSRTYKRYFILENDYNNLNLNENSLRTYYHDLNEVVFENKGRDYTNGREILSLIFSKYFHQNFFLYETFKEQVTINVIALIKDIFAKYLLDNQALKFNSNIDSINKSVNINFPKRYSNLVFKEIANNFRHSHDVNINFKINDSFLEIEIFSTKSESKLSGTNSGSAIFENLKHNSFFDCDCIVKQESNTYQQNLKFKVVSHD